MFETVTGVISELWRYPVKSMQGERLQHATLNKRGLEGDRLFALQDASGKLGSGKDTRRFRQIDGLLDLQSKSASADWPTIVFPDGRELRGDDPATNRALSGELNTEVQLIEETEISHLDAGAVHVITSNQIGWIKSLIPDLQDPQARFRPNIIVDEQSQSLDGEEWLERDLRIGDDVVIRITRKAERCRMVSLKQRDLPSDPRILKQIVGCAEKRFGFYAEVLHPGTMSIGDKVDLHS